MSIVKHRRLPTLRSPIAILAFGGWGDAAEASTTALTTLSAEWECRPFATIDPDDFYDFTQVRPRVYLNNEMMREVEWPVGTFAFRRRPEAEHDVVVFRALEPHLQWKRYVGGVLDFLESLKLSMLVTMGSLLADVPHTRPVQLSGFATDARLQELLRESGIGLSRYEGPTGILGVLHDCARSRNIPSMSLWAAAPHYIAAAANPTVALALLDKLAAILGWSLDLASFREEARSFDSEVDAIIQANAEASAYVSHLEQAMAEAAPTSSALPSNEVLLRDLEDFLRRGREGRGDSGERG